MKNVFRRLWVVGFVLISASACSSEESWWMMCDRCTSDTHFEERAIAAPGDYSVVYVSNRDTNETRKFDRKVQVTELDEGLELRVAVQPLDLSQRERRAFETAIRNANVNSIEIDRSDLDSAGSVSSSASSVIGDTLAAHVSASFLNSLVLYIQRSELSPGPQSVSRAAGINIVGAGEYSGRGITIRIKSIVTTVSYADSSMLQVLRDTNGRFTGWSIQDANGNRIPLDLDPNDVPILRPELFVSRTFEFDAAHADEVIWLAGHFSDSSEITCATEPRTQIDDGSELIGITCARSS